MFAQLFLGIAMIAMGVCHWFGSTFFLGRRAKNTIRGQDLRAYQKGLALPYVLFGVVFIAMGFVERGNFLPTPVFIGLYLVLGGIPLALLLANNKKHTGGYFV